MNADRYRQCLEAARRLMAQGQIDQARLSLENAHKLAPTRPEALEALAGLAMQSRQFQAAAGYFGELLGLLSSAKARCRLQVQRGCALQLAGQLEAAAEAFAAALELDPKRGDAAQNLGALLIHLGRYEAAEAALQVAARARPPLAESLGLLAFLALRRGESAQAESLARQALALRADAHEARYQLASALKKQDRRQEAEREYLTLLKAGFRRADCLLALSDLALKRTDLQQARHWLEQLLSLRPDSAAWQQWTQMLLVSGDTAGANREYDRLLAQTPGPEVLRLAAARIQSRYCDPGVSARALREDHRDFARRCALLRAARPALPIQPDAEGQRSLRIGFFQPDSFTHPSSYLLRMLLEYASPGLETHVFTLPGRQDALTARMQALAGNWHWLDKRDTALASNASQMAEAGLDVLLDFAGFSSWNPWPLLALQPALRIVTGLGLPVPTGLPFVSACISDPWCDEAGDWASLQAGSEGYEPALTLPSWICWEAPADAPPLTEPEERPFTFGSPHNLAKLSPALLAEWAQLLAACPGSRLLIKAPFVHDAGVRERLLAPFAAGLADRVALEPAAGYRDYLAFYQRIDCVLDSWPYPGGTTSCEALWMGVPVLVRPARHAGGLSLVSQAGHPEWACASLQEQLLQARVLAEAGLRSLAERQALRDRVGQAPAFRPRDWAEGVEAALRGLIPF